LAGSNKKIVWKAREELGSFKGNLRWEVRGDIIPSFLNFTNVTSGKTLRRGKDFNVQWEDNENVQNLKFDLFRSGLVIRDLGEIDNNGSWDWKIPKNVRLGPEYRLRAISGNKVAFSTDFRMGPKFPLVIKLAPLVIGLTVGVLLLLPDDKPVTQEIIITDPIEPN